MPTLRRRFLAGPYRPTAALIAIAAATFVPVVSATGCAEESEAGLACHRPGTCADAASCAAKPVCSGHGACVDNTCQCSNGFSGPFCDLCAQPALSYPDCIECSSDASCPIDTPHCVDNRCVACLDGATAPPDFCLGICTLSDALCVDGQWQCTPWESQPQDEKCDGFDNNCDGVVDEGCASCEPDIARIRANLFGKWDIDFDFQCNTYLTSMVSGADFVDVVPVDGAIDVSRYFGNANQNMGYALVDPDPSHKRVVVTYSCCPACACMAQNGLTLLYTCDPAEPDCGCAGQANCPGFLNEPFLPAGYVDTSVSHNGGSVTAPNGLAAGPSNSYYVANYRPTRCSSDPACVPCDPTHPDIWCEPDGSNCCDTSPLGRLVQFTLPDAGQSPRWRVVHIFDGEEILGLASGRDGTVLVGSYAGYQSGNLYRFDPVRRQVQLLQTFAGTVFSITQVRASGDWYVEVKDAAKLYRFAEDGSPLPLPPGIPTVLGGEGIVQAGPDGRLYRLIGRTRVDAFLEVYDL